ncbi:MAG: ComEC/Rec2 family competence protein [Alphaproteobacteria bacterium]|nr:ComEC/Rec2 family competence protein [Alphaproteobacteria bacterium]MBN9569249.1 ComEC/Rec2 family competence protein [Alphaproteobacteria bacterium]MBN9591371.1 ComEC/Rec2 family competence protein [Alphaproteobacteria bacterium]
MGVGPLPFFRFRGEPGAAAGVRQGFLAPFGVLGRAMLAERERWFLWLPVALCAGIGAYFALPAEPPAGFAALAVFAALVCVSLVRRWPSDWALALAGLFAAALIGFAAAQIRTARIATPVLTHRISYTQISGRIVSAEERGKGARVTLEHVESDRRVEMPRRVRIFIRTDPASLVPGQWIAANVSLMPPPGPAAPGDYDFARWAFYRGIGAVGFAFGKVEFIPPRQAARWLDRWDAQLERLRGQITARVRAVLPGPEGGISAAMITGERGGIAPGDLVAFRNSGLAHILSISGLHLALAGGFFFWMVRAALAAIPAIALRYPIKKWAALAAIGGSGFYLLISGCDTPAVRSYIMLTIMFLAVLVDRPALTMRSVAIAAGLILLFQPESLIEPGFEMSFAAVIGLIALAEWEAMRARNDDGVRPGPVAHLRRYMGGIVWASLIATLATAPFAIFHFDRSAQYGVLANLASMPIAGFIIMPAATLAMIALPFGLERWPLLVMGKGVDLMLVVAHWVAGLPGATAMAAAWPIAALVLMTGGGLWLALWRRRLRWLGLVPVAAGLLLTLADRPPDLLIGRDGETIALRGDDGRLSFLRPPPDDYTASTWLVRDGDGRTVEAATGGPAIRCDALGCVAETKAVGTIAAPLRAAAIAQDCVRAAIVISARPARRLCSGPRLVIDRFDTAREGGYAIWFDEKFKVKTVSAARGERPWNPKRNPRPPVKPAQ